MTMWLWGSILGLLAGASKFGWTGALWGAVIGWLAGMLLAKQGKAAGQSLKSNDLEKRLALTQKALEEIRARLDRLEKPSPVPPTPPVKTTTDEAVIAPLAPAMEPRSSSPSSISPSPVQESIEPQAAAAVMSQSATKVMQVPNAASIVEGVVPHATAVAAMSSPSSSSPPTPPAPPAAQKFPATSPPTPEPIGPTFIERLLEGNIVAKLGVVILFFGVGFLLKFAYDRGLFPPELRLFVVAAASAVMFLIGHRLLASKRTYALVMMGGAMGLLYLDVFFALKTFGIISAPVGFLLFAALGIATLFLAVRLDARVFAALGLIGAFLAPILASTGSGNHVLLFSYYLLLNLVILGASWYKSWRELNFIGFLFTFAIAIFWGHSSYRPEHFATVEPFLIAFFLLYLAIPILFAQRQPPELKGVVDGTLIFGVPMSAAMLQAALTRDMGDYALAWSAGGAALIYAGLAWALWDREKMRLLAEAHLALAVVFGTVAPYFAFRGYPTFAFWTLEGAAIFWMGCRQKSVLARAFALCLQVCAAGYFWWVTQDQELLHSWWNDRVIGSGLIAGAALMTAWFMHRYEQSISALETSIEVVAIGWGGAWLLTGFGLGALNEWTSDAACLSAMLIFIASAMMIFEWLGTWLDWRKLRNIARAHVVLIGVATLLWMKLLPGSHPILAVGVIAWPLTFASYFYVLHRQRRDAIESSSGWRYTSGWILMVLLATWEALWRYDHREFGWVFAIGVAGLIAAELRFRLREYVPNETKDGVKPLRFSTLPMWWALIWWFAGLHGAIDAHTASMHHLALHLVAAAISILLFEIAGQLQAWTALRRTQLLLTAAMLLGALNLVANGVNPFRDAQFFAWLAAFAIGEFVLSRQERDGMARFASIQHVGLFALALWLVGFEAVWRTDEAGLSLSWQYAGAGLTAALGLAMATFGVVRQIWPFAAHAIAFRHWAIAPLLMFALIWTLIANSICDGTASPLPYFPIVNPLDFAQLALIAAGVWALNHNAGGNLQDSPQARDLNNILKLLFAAGAFLWVNAALLRTVHQWVGVPFELHALLDSRIAQAALSLLWTSTALVLMMAAGRKQSRPLWMAGAALLGLVVLKLFVNDIGTSGTERVVSFIGVGLLLMVIGYVAPVPPRASIEEKGSAVP
ncbi:MAG: DUF2339 domain-containing protein [Betaproteobacteria bacterium]|nr:DUF2339 domain-containing protein [Betaproteobacteria bacterium]